MKRQKVASGMWWVEIPEADLRVLCGCPADAVKHLRKHGLIHPESRDGVTFESGPNAILLSDTPTQNGSFANLAEFPLLQMFYRQGMLIPGHPNAGRRPLLIGLEDQLKSQCGYFLRGNYGLTSVEEIIACGVPPETAAEMFEMKKWFAFGRILPVEKLVDIRAVAAEALMLAPGVYIHRKGLNRYVFLAGRQAVEVDLSLDPDEQYEAPYRLPSRSISREEFSVIHIGEGDGWDVDRPCMGSLICFRGFLYLIDAAPHIEQSLDALGVRVNEIQGIFHTHSHDDHFAGLTSLVSVGRPLRYFAAPCVRATTQKKLAALMGISENQFSELFEPHDLAPAVWNTVDGMEVKPLYAPHPVETTVFIFRAPCGSTTRSYAHFADISSFEVLGKLSPGGSLLAPFRQEMLRPVDVKKLDVGGGLIHGRAEDFSADPSTKIVLSHGIASLTDEQKKIGIIADFGAADALIPAQCPGAKEQPGVSTSCPPQPSAEVEFLLGTRLFGGCVPGSAMEKIASAMDPRALPAGQAAEASSSPELCLVAEGELAISIGDRFLETVGPGGFWGEEQIVHEGTVLYQARAARDSRFFALPSTMISGLPSVRWKLFEAFARRMRLFRTAFHFEWQDFFSVGVRDLDDQHKQLFALADELSESVRLGLPAPQQLERKRALISHVRFHFSFEEQLLARHGHAQLAAQQKEHAGLLARLTRAPQLDENRPFQAAGSVVDFLKDWLVRHTLLEDLQYREFFQKSGGRMEAEGDR